MTQSQALKVMLSGANVFLSGAPGSGKSFLLEEFIRIASRKGKTIATTATTGISANLIHGMTIHSWSGLGTIKVISKSDLKKLFKRPGLEDRLCAAQILIIDEISMLDAQVLDCLNTLLKHFRGNGEAFGGLQVILCGDFFQLPPVSLDLVPYAFLAKSWQELGLEICYLNEQHRQEDAGLYEVLVALRERRLMKRHVDLLLDRQNVKHGQTTILLTHNSEVDRLNTSRLELLSSKSMSFEMVMRGNLKESELIAKSVLAPKVLVLKVGALVMFVANSPREGFFNGTQGKVIGFKKGLPIVEIDGSGQRISVNAYSWRREDKGRVIAEAIQLPLKLAWAITIHKSQGMSLSSAEIDLSRSFTYGMGYVALSRLRTMDGLYLRGINSRSLQLDPKVYEFYGSLGVINK